MAAFFTPPRVPRLRVDLGAGPGGGARGGWPAGRRAGWSLGRTDGPWASSVAGALVVGCALSANGALVVGCALVVGAISGVATSPGVGGECPRLGVGGFPGAGALAGMCALTTGCGVSPGGGVAGDGGGPLRATVSRAGDGSARSGTSMVMSGLSGSSYLAAASGVLMGDKSPRVDSSEEGSMPQLGKREQES